MYGTLTNSDEANASLPFSSGTIILGWTITAASSVILSYKRLIYL